MIFFGVFQMISGFNLLQYKYTSWGDIEKYYMVMGASVMVQVKCFSLPFKHYLKSTSFAHFNHGQSKLYRPMEDLPTLVPLAQLQEGWQFCHTEPLFHLLYLDMDFLGLPCTNFCLSFK
eukprot:31163_5